MHGRGCNPAGSASCRLGARSTTGTCVSQVSSPNFSCCANIDWNLRSNVCSCQAAGGSSQRERRRCPTQARSCPASSNKETVSFPSTGALVVEQLLDELADEGQVRAHLRQCEVVRCPQQLQRPRLERRLKPLRAHASTNLSHRCHDVCQLTALDWLQRARPERRFQSQRVQGPVNTGTAKRGGAQHPGASGAIHRQQQQQQQQQAEFSSGRGTALSHHQAGGGAQGDNRLRRT